MGGRGGNSGSSGGGDSTKVSGFDITFPNGENARYYFTSFNGVNYYQRGIGGTPEPTPLNMTVKEFRRRVESNGAKVASISKSERKADEARYKTDRKANNDFQDQHWFDARPRKGMKGH